MTRDSVLAFRNMFTSTKSKVYLNQDSKWVGCRQMEDIHIRWSEWRSNLVTFIDNLCISLFSILKISVGSYFEFSSTECFIQYVSVFEIVVILFFEEEFRRSFHNPRGYFNLIRIYSYRVVTAFMNRSDLHYFL